MSEEQGTYELAIHHQELTPSVWGMLERLATASHLSRAFGTRTEGEAAMKFLFCYENRLPLSAANMGLYVVNGRLAVMANVIAAQIRRHPDYDYEIKTLTDQECTVVILRRNGDGQMHAIGESTFTISDAHKAGLVDKENWRNYPRNCLFGRAITNGQRWYAPDVFSQPVYVPEELGANTDSDGAVIDGQATIVKPALTLDSLLEHWSAEQILVANSGKVPETQEELNAVKAALEAQDIEKEEMAARDAAMPVNIKPTNGSRMYK